MLRLILVFFLMIAVPQLAVAEPAPEIAKTWALFQDALRQNSAESLARISKFPIHSNEFGGSIKNQEILIKRFAKIFTPKTIQCLLAQTPTPQKDGKKVYFEAFCDNDIYPIRYIFEKVGPDFRFTSIDNINE
jgi:hypothetical protein